MDRQDSAMPAPMPQTEMTEAEMNLAMEVEAHNLYQLRGSEGYLDVMRAIGLAVPAAESVDGDGRWRFDFAKVEAEIAALARPRVLELLRGVRDMGPRAANEESNRIDLALRLRREAIETEAFRTRIASQEDAGALEATLAEMQEEISEIESSGPFWALDHVNLAMHRGLRDREAACQERLAEITPSGPRPF